MTNEEHINGLKGIKPFLQGFFLKENYEGCGELDAREVGETIDVAIYALENIDRIKDERDAALKDLQTVISEGSNFCRMCKYREADGQCYHDCIPYSWQWAWEWRGIQD